MVVDIIGDGAKVQLLGEVYELTISFDGSGTGVEASEVSIIDEGGYYESGNVEGALQEAGANIDTLASEIEGLDTRLDTAETDISDLQAEVGNTIKVGDNELGEDEYVSIARGSLFAFLVGGAEGTGRGLLVARSLDGTLESTMDANQTNVFISHVNNSLSTLARVKAQNGILFFEATYRADFLTPAKYVSDYAALFDEFDRYMPDAAWVRAKVSDLESAIYEVLDTIDNTLSGYADTFASKQYTSAIQTLTISSGLIAWNMSLGQRAKVTLTANSTLSNPTNATAAFPDLEVRQDATGGRVLSFGTSFVTPVGYTAAPTTANSYTLYHFQLRSDGKFSVAYTHYAS